MTGALYTHTTRATGTVLTAAIYNADHTNHVVYGYAAYLGGDSDTVGQMRTTADPGESGSESLASSIADEIERLRFAIYECKLALDSSLSYWYESPVDLAGTGRLPPWYISGLELSVQASSPGFIEVATGICRDAADTINMRVSTAKHRGVSGLWVTAATGGGVGVTWTKFVPYHVFVIKTQASAFDIGFDTVLTASNILARASGTKYRRIGSLNTATTAGRMRPVYQIEDEVYFQDPGYHNPTLVANLPSGIHANAAFQVPALPSGIVLGVKFHAWVTAPGAKYNIYDFNATHGYLDVQVCPGASVGAAADPTPLIGQAWSSPSAALRYSAFFSTSGIKFITRGWKDRRK